MKNNKKISIQFIELSGNEYLKDCKIYIEKNELKLQKVQEEKTLLIKEYCEIEKRISSLNNRSKKIQSWIDERKEYIKKQS